MSKPGHDLGFASHPLPHLEPPQNCWVGPSSPPPSFIPGFFMEFEPFWALAKEGKGHPALGWAGLHKGEAQTAPKIGETLPECPKKLGRHSQSPPKIRETLPVPYWPPQSLKLFIFPLKLLIFPLKLFIFPPLKLLIFSPLELFIFPLELFIFPP